MGSTENTPRIRNIKTIHLKDSELNIFIIGKSKNQNNIMLYPEIGENTSSSYGLIGLKEINKSCYTEETYNCEYHCFNHKFKQNDVILKTTWNIYYIKYEIDEKLLHVLLHFLHENGQSNKKNNVIICMNSENNKEEDLLKNTLKKLETNSVLYPFIIHIGNYPITQEFKDNVKLEFITHLPNFNSCKTEIENTDENESLYNFEKKI